MSEIIRGNGGPSEYGWHEIEPAFRCPKEYQYARIRKITERIEQEPVHLAVGQLFHAARAEWYFNKFDTSEATYQKILVAMEEAEQSNKRPVPVEAREKALVLINEYINHWAGKPKPDVKCIEYLLGPFQLHPSFSDTKFTARIDDASCYPETGGKIVIGELKTTSVSIEDAINQYSLHGQPVLQMILWNHPNNEKWRELNRFEKVNGILLDIVKKPYGKTKAAFGRAFVPISQKVLDWHEDALTKVSGNRQLSWNMLTSRNITACTRQIGRMRIKCLYADLCTNGRNAIGKYVFADGTPLASWTPEPGKETPPWE